MNPTDRLISSSSSPNTSSSSSSNEEINSSGGSVASNNDPAVSTENQKSGGVRKKNYKRQQDKPPYSYQALIIAAIHSSSSSPHQMTLRQIFGFLEKSFSFFRGEYRGWRDSIRHNLTSSSVFEKVLKDPSKPTKKSNFWRVKLELVTTIVHRDVAAIQELLRLKNINGNRADSSKVDGYRAEIDEKENFANVEAVKSEVTTSTPIGNQLDFTSEQFWEPRLETNYSDGSRIPQTGNFFGDFHWLNPQTCSYEYQQLHGERYTLPAPVQLSPLQPKVFQPSMQFFNPDEYLRLMDHQKNPSAYGPPNAAFSMQPYPQSSYNPMSCLQSLTNFYN
ncbi:forkhead box C1-A-like [Symsagittifera roscoffensis]|uniref:forkhead box C1-A-like n=1 Tax=Symsagittifera roscoffensis TaxID=84072 RepID=UPI00307C5E16